jgi:hypothetical protein
MISLRLFVLLSLFSFSVSSHYESANHALPRPLIVEYSEFAAAEDVKERCTSWRVAGEANNLSPWKTVPEECTEYVKEYLTGRGYVLDLQTVSKEAEEYAKSVRLEGDGKDAWIFDIDETLLSNLPYYAAHGYGYVIYHNNEKLLFRISKMLRLLF